MSSMTMAFRINHKSPLYQWVRQIEETGGSVSQRIRDALECQLAQDTNSTYQKEYKRLRMHAMFWRAYKKVTPKNSFELNWPHVAKECQIQLKPLQDDPYNPEYQVED
jgi:hypothetical protein